jgi:hypothetical protein
MVRLPWDFKEKKDSSADIQIVDTISVLLCGDYARQFEREFEKVTGLGRLAFSPILSVKTSKTLAFFNLHCPR